MDVSLLIRHRLKELGLDQKDLAAAAQVTESYISQLLARKKSPPLPGRTEIYEKIGKFLKLPSGELSNLAELQRKEELRKKVAEGPQPLFPECRDLILRKCTSQQPEEVRRIFEQQPFGELERLVTQTLLEVAQGVARAELSNSEWLPLVAGAVHLGQEQARTALLEFLDVDVFNLSAENAISFLDAIVDSWDINLKTFGITVIPSPRLTAGNLKRFEFTEVQPPQEDALEPGLEEFLNDRSLSGDATEEEIAFLKALKLAARRPSPIYYYRELQNLRDPLHFPAQKVRNPIDVH